MTDGITSEIVALRAEVQELRKAVARLTAPSSRIDRPQWGTFARITRRLGAHRWVSLGWDWSSRLAEPAWWVREHTTEFWYDDPAESIYADEDVCRRIYDDPDGCRPASGVAFGTVAVPVVGGAR